MFLRLDLFHLLLIALICFLAGWVIWRDLRTKHTASDESRNFEIKKARLCVRIVTFFITLILLGVAALGPTGLVTSSSVQGASVFFVLDVSKSMNVTDIEQNGTSISRLDRAKTIIHETIEKHPENRYGLIIFSGESRLITPLTSDLGAIDTFLGSVDSNSIRNGGTDFEDAIALTLSRLDPDDSGTTGIFLLSDGGEKEDLTNKERFSHLFDGKKAALFTIPVGSSDGGAIPNGTDLFGQPAFEQYQGSPVISRLNRSNLDFISNT